MEFQVSSFKFSTLNAWPFSVFSFQVSKSVSIREICVPFVAFRAFRG
jgi:hypothetical protein